MEQRAGEGGKGIDVNREEVASGGRDAFFDPEASSVETGGEGSALHGNEG